MTKSAFYYCLLTYLSGSGAALFVLSRDVTCQMESAWCHDFRRRRASQHVLHTTHQ